MINASKGSSEKSSDESGRSFRAIEAVKISNPNLEKVQLLWNSLLRNRNNGNNQIHRFQQL